MSIWIDTAIQFIPVGQRVAANARAAAHGNYFPSDTDEFTWNGARECTHAAAPIPPATHLMVSERIRQPQKDAFVNFGSDIPSGKVYLESDGWTIQSALDDMGLKLIEDDDDL